MMTRIEEINAKLKRIENKLWEINMADRLTYWEQKEREELQKERQNLLQERYILEHQEG